MVGIDDSWIELYLELKNKDTAKESGHNSDIIDVVISNADPKKLKDIETEVVIHASILDLLDFAAKPEHISKEGYTNMLQRLHTGIVLRLAAMGVDVTHGE
jgi:hypothetical protein